MTFPSNEHTFNKQPAGLVKVYSLLLCTGLASPEGMPVCDLSGIWPGLDPGILVWILLMLMLIRLLILAYALYAIKLYNNINTTINNNNNVKKNWCISPVFISIYQYIFDEACCQVLVSMLHCAQTLLPLEAAAQ